MEARRGHSAAAKCRLEAVKTYDVIVLGGGSAGTAAAKAAAGAGARTLMFNDGELGGLCILRGCMPTKTMLHAAYLAHHARHHRTPGVRAKDVSLDFAAVMANKDAKVARFKKAKLAGIASGGYEVVDARARFTGPDTVEAGSESYRFARGAVIATGSVPALPQLTGIDEVPYWTSDDALRADEAPASMLVVGVGAIGLELATFFARMGSEVQLVGRRRPFDDVGELFADEMARVAGAEPRLRCHFPARPTAVRGDAAGVHLQIERTGRRQELSAATLLLATGRSAALDGLDLHVADIEVRNGRVTCGPDMQTTNPRVFVAGDATGDTLILHVANWEGRVAGLGAAQVPGPHRVEQRLRMAVRFTDPPMAEVGMTPDQARAAGHTVAVALARFPETGRAITMDVEHGVWQLVADASSGEILGAQILGPHADELIHTIAAVMYYRGSADDLLHMPWYHPTLSEVTLSLARDIEQRRREQG